MKCVACLHRGWTTLYHFLLVFLLPIWAFVVWAHKWDPNHLLNHLWLRLFTRILGQNLIYLCLQIPQATFVMVSLCYAQRLGYLFHIMFLSPSSLQHYAKSNICTIVMLEKLVGVVSFGGSTNHLISHEATLLTSLSMFDLRLVVRTIALVFLGCQAPITPTLVIRFQQDDYLILLDVITHVEINISLFQMALRDTQTTLPQVFHS